MAWYITPHNTVLEYTTTVGRDAGKTKDLIKLSNGMIVEAQPERLFAVHPDENKNLELVDGVWHYKGEPL